MSKLEKITNVAIILTCTLVIGNLLRNYYISVLPDLNNTQRANEGKSLENQEIKLPISSTIASHPTLLMVLSENCRFCTESTPFYQKLSQFKSSSKTLKLIALFPENKDNVISYLKQNNITVDNVLSMPISTVGVRGTPTLLLLNQQSKVEKAWIGKLNSSQESEVIAELKKVCRDCKI